MNSEEYRKLIHEEFQNIELSTIEFDELLTKFAKQYNKEQLELYNIIKDFNIDYFVDILKRTLEGDERVKVEFNNEEDNINYILDICSCFKKQLEQELF